MPRPRKQRIKRKQKLLKSFLKKERKSTPKSTPFLYNKEQPSQSAEKASVASNAKKRRRRRIGRRGERRREPPCSSLHPQATGSTASAYKTKASTGIRRGSTSTSTTTGTTPHNAKLSTATDCFVTLTRTGATGHTTALSSHIGTTNAETDKN